MHHDSPPPGWTYWDLDEHSGVLELASPPLDLRWVEGPSGIIWFWLDAAEASYDEAEVA